MMFTYDWWVSLIAFLGVAILSWPVLSLNARRKRLQELRDADRPEQDDAGFRKAARDILIGRRERHVSDWRRLDEICLILGYLLLFGSSLARLYPHS